MELNMPGWMVYPFSAKRYMTAPHARAANAEKCFADGGMGRAAAADPGCGENARGMRVATTLETTYSTI